MRFLSHESLRVILLNAKQHLIKVLSVSEGTLNEAVAHPREIFKPVIIHSAYGFILAHNLWVATHKLCYVERGPMCGLPGHPFLELNNYSLSATIGLILVARSAWHQTGHECGYPKDEHGYAQ